MHRIHRKGRMPSARLLTNVLNISNPCQFLARWPTLVMDSGCGSMLLRLSKGRLMMTNDIAAQASLADPNESARLAATCNGNTQPDIDSMWRIHTLDLTISLYRLRARRM